MVIQTVAVIYVTFKPYPNTGPNDASSGLIHASNGLLYGMSEGGGKFDSGTIYTFNTRTGAINVVYSFGGTHGDGAYPDGTDLLQLSNGVLYGVTWGGGDAAGEGVLFSFNPANNTEKVLVTFNGTDGSYPSGSLIRDPDKGLLYGTTIYGGSAGYGVLFSYDVTTNTYTKLLDFTGSNGSYPVSLTLVDTAIHLGVNTINIPLGSIKVYPNPSNGLFTFQLPGVSSPLSVGVYNVMESGKAIITR